MKCYRCKTKISKDMCLNCGMTKLDSEVYYEKEEELKGEQELK